MTMIPGLVRRAAAEAEHQLRGGLRLLARLGGDPDRSAELERILPAYGDRIRLLEEALQEQDTSLHAVRADLDSLVLQLNERLLPRIDERMDDTERDLTAVAASLIGHGRETSANRGRLDTIEQRVGDLRAKLARMEQGASLWRDLQASVARLGDDIDTLRSRVAVRTADPVRPAEPAHGAEHVRNAQPVRAAEPLSGTEARS